MFGSVFRQAAKTAVLMALALASLCAAPASALERSATRDSCWTSSRLSQDIALLTRSAQRWTCNGDSYSIAGERVALRFDIDRGGVQPRYLFSRRSAMQGIHLLAIEADGTIRHRAVATSELQNSRAGGFFKLPLANLTPATRHVIVAFDLPSHRMTLENAFLAPSDPSDTAEHTRSLLLLAALCGMLAMPLVFNAAFYRILREPFVLWHSALAVSLMLTILVSSGLAAVLFDLPVMTLSSLTTLIFGISVACGAMFAHSFIEPGRLHPLLRRALLWSAGWALFLSFFHAAFPFVARPVQSPIYTAAFAPILAVFIWALADALRRGSRAAKFQVVGWTPMVAVALIRLVSGLVPSIASNDAMLLFYFGCVFEVLSTAMGVADRFMALKHQRDSARTEAELLERLSERDPLTSLFNRRALEARFAAFRAEGFDTLAVLDLDHFKAINDRHGHGVGDAVLKATATALQRDAGVLAFRYGGEEFVLLLRGEDAPVQAERRRQSIPAIVAASVPGLSLPVTASMGVTALSPADPADLSFDRPFERADKLLYEAKLAGRNRVMPAVMPQHQKRPRRKGAAAA